MSVIKDRELMRSEISAYCKKLVLSQRAVALCETEATPSQEEFLHRVLTEEMLTVTRAEVWSLRPTWSFPSGDLYSQMTRWQLQ
jgi:hypothetical protein